MARSSSPKIKIEDEIDDVIDFLLENEEVIIADLRKEFDKRISSGRILHKRFKLQAFDYRISNELYDRIRDMYTHSKRWYITTEDVLIISTDEKVRKIVISMIKKIMTKE